MSKKVLVIEDWEELIEFIKSKASYWANANRIMEKLTSYALHDPVMFEAEVEEDTRSGATTCDMEECVYLPDELQESNDFKLGDKLQVIVAKLPEKSKKDKPKKDNRFFTPEIECNSSKW